ELLAEYAKATAASTRLAHRSGQNAADLRVAVRLAVIATHAASIEIATRLAASADAAPALQALGSALDDLASVHAELAAGAGAFSYPAAYVPLALGPQDIAQHRTNFEAVKDFATDDLARFEQVTSEAW